MRMTANEFANINHWQKYIKPSQHLTKKTKNFVAVVFLC